MSLVRYLNKSNNQNERLLISRMWKEQIEHMGTLVRYHTHGYNLSAHDFLYGEDPISGFENVGEIVMLTDITNDAVMLSKFGIQADCDMTAIVHMQSFQEVFGEGAEPKVGDVLELVEFGGTGDRMNGRGAPKYEITERDDQNIASINALLGHYVWQLKCKRWEYSYEKGISAEPRNTQLNDTGFYGLTDNPLSPPYFPPDSIKNLSKQIIDPDCVDNDVYGGL